MYEFQSSYIINFTKHFIYECEQNIFMSRQCHTCQSSCLIYFALLQYMPFYGLLNFPLLFVLYVLLVCLYFPTVSHVALAVLNLLRSMPPSPELWVYSSVPLHCVGENDTLDFLNARQALHQLNCISSLHFEMLFCLSNVITSMIIILHKSVCT